MGKDLPRAWQVTPQNSTQGHLEQRPCPPLSVITDQPVGRAGEGRREASCLQGLGLSKESTSQHHPNLEGWADAGARPRQPVPGPRVIRAKPFTWRLGLAAGEENSQVELMPKLWPGPEVPAQGAGLMRNQSQTFIALGPLSPGRQVLASGRAKEGMWSLGTGERLYQAPHIPGREENELRKQTQGSEPRGLVHSGFQRVPGFMLELGTTVLGTEGQRPVSWGGLLTYNPAPFRSSWAQSTESRAGWGSRISGEFPQHQRVSEHFQHESTPLARLVVQRVVNSKLMGLAVSIKCANTGRPLRMEPGQGSTESRVAITESHGCQIHFDVSGVRMHLTVDYMAAFLLS